MEAEDPAVEQEESEVPERRKYDLPSNNRQYCAKAYWEDRFAREEKYEWLLSWDDLENQIRPYVQEESSAPAALDEATGEGRYKRVLVVGCGNAPFSAGLYKALQGRVELLNIDYSPTVIGKMKERYPVHEYPNMRWEVMDMTNLTSLADSSFDVVLDKAAMDAMLAGEGDVWNPNDDSILMSRQMCQHVARILSDDNGSGGGCFLQVSLAQPHFRKKYLLGWHNTEAELEASTDQGGEDRDPSYSSDYGWSFRFEEVSKEGGAGLFGHYLYIMEKGSKV